MAPAAHNNDSWRRVRRRWERMKNPSHLLITEKSISPHVVWCVGTSRVEAQRQHEPPFVWTVLNFNSVIQSSPNICIDQSINQGDAVDRPNHNLRHVCKYLQCGPSELLTFMSVCPKKLSIPSFVRIKPPWQAGSASCCGVSCGSSRANTGFSSWPFGGGGGGGGGGPGGGHLGHGGAVLSQ